MSAVPAPAPSFAEVAGASPVSDGSFSVVRSNYVPAQMEKHIEFLDFNSNGDLIVGASSLTTRFWSGSVWYYKDGFKAEEIVNTVGCVTGLDLETGVVDGKFLANSNQFVLGLDSGAVCLASLTKEHDGDRLTYYIEQQATAIEHDDILTGLDYWKDDGSIASIGADQRLNIFSPNLALLHSYHPAHSKQINSVACSSAAGILATASREGTVKVWDTRQPKPAKIVYNNELRPPSSVIWHLENNLVIGGCTGDVFMLDIRGNPEEYLMEEQLFDREIFRFNWSPDRSKLAIAGNDVTVGVVTVMDGLFKVEMKDERHTDYVRGLAWRSEEVLWSAGWDHKIYKHDLN